MAKAVLFDFDGTLADSAPGIVKTMEQTLLHMGLRVPDKERMVATIGIPLKAALQQAAGLDDAEADQATTIYRQLFLEYEAGLVTLFPHVKETLYALQEAGVRMALVTSRDQRSLNLLTGSRGLDSFFETRVTGADGYAPKPAPDMVKALLERMDLDAEDVLVVGDTTYDIQMGNSAGCCTVAVTYGNHSRERLLEVNPTFVIDSFDNILTHI